MNLCLLLDVQASVKYFHCLWIGYYCMLICRLITYMDTESERWQSELELF